MADPMAISFAGGRQIAAIWKGRHDEAVTIKFDFSTPIEVGLISGCLWLRREPSEDDDRVWRVTLPASAQPHSLSRLD